MEALGDTMFVLATLRPLRTSISSSLLLLIGIDILRQPIAKHMSIVQFIVDTSFGWLWVLGALGAVYMLFCGSILLSRVVFFRAVALYEDRGHIIFLFPFFMDVQLDQIDDVRASDRPTLFWIARNIIIKKTNGRESIIWATFLVEPEESIISRIKELAK